MADKLGRLFADAMMPIQIVHALRRLGYEVQTVQQFQGTSRPEVSLSDEAVLEAAIQFQATVITMNGKDFARIHCAAHHTHNGIIICNESADYEKRAKEIEEVLKASKPLTGKLISIPPKRTEAFSDG